MHADQKTRWVPVAVASDIPKGTVIPARLPHAAIAVWRSAAGTIHANGDRCPHRGMRLSHGFVRGNSLSCIYHGWRFGTDGACQHIPAHPDVVPPKTINCGPLPVTEVNGTVWVAAAKPSEAPPRYPGHEALRSMVISASPKAICNAAGGTISNGMITTNLGGQETLILMNPFGDNEVLVIALVKAQLDAPKRLVVSNAMEALRRTAENDGIAA